MDALIVSLIKPPSHSEQIIQGQHFCVRDWCTYFQEHQNNVDRFRKESDLLNNADLGEGESRGETGAAPPYCG